VYVFPVAGVPVIKILGLFLLNESVLGILKEIYFNV
jgi:hypothetical protein